MTATVHSEEALVLRQDEAGVATLTLNRPKQYNALSQAMLGALQAALDAIAADRTVRVVVIAGAFLVIGPLVFGTGSSNSPDWAR